MQRDPTLAVVIPNFNYARFLPKTIESVLSQEPKFDEIVVVDDGSSDGSQELLKTYVGVIKFIAIENSGELGAYRTGIEATASDYIYTLDADDFAVPGLVAEVRKALTGRPAKVQFQLAGVNTEGVSLGSSFPIYPQEYAAAAMRLDDRRRGTHVCPPTSGNVFSRLALQKIPLATYDARGTMDGSPMFAMPYLGEVISINKPLACYRVHTGGMSSGSKPTPHLLRREIRFFHKSWIEAIPSLYPTFVDFDRDDTLFVAERRMMIAGLEGKVFMCGLVFRYIYHLMKCRVPFRQLVIFFFWSLALLLPFKGLKKSLIESRRSSSNRPRRLQALVSALTRARSGRR